MKLEEMADIFLNSANFVSHAFLTLAPSSCYALNLKALIKLAEHLSFHMKYLDLHLKENLIRQTSFLRKVHLQKPTSFRVKQTFSSRDQDGLAGVGGAPPIPTALLQKSPNSWQRHKNTNLE